MTLASLAALGVVEPLVLHHTSETPPGFLSQEVLGEAFYAATKEREIPGFEFGYLVATRSGKTVATVPYFLTDFKLNTMLEGGWLKRLLGDTGFRMACVGHPCTPFGRIDGAPSSELMDLVFDCLKQYAPVVSLKGFSKHFPVTGFVQVKGLPVAVMTVNKNHWKKMSSARRRNLQRKRKKASALSFDVTEGLPEHLHTIVYGLYLQTLARSTIHFDQLSLDYFVSTAKISQYVFAYLDAEVVGFIQTVRKGEELVALYVGFDEVNNQLHGIYFALGIRLVDMAIEMDCSILDLGETHYAFKKALGCELQGTWVYFRFKNYIWHWVMSKFSFLIDPSPKELS